MKFLLISKCGEGAGLLSKIKDEGNDVRMYVKEKDYASVYKGIIDQCSLSSSWIDDDTVIIFDSSGMGKIADQLKKTNKVLGASAFHDKIEYDRAFGLDLMRSVGIKVPDTLEFGVRDWESAVSFVHLAKNERFVFKPDGDVPSRLTYLPSDSEDLIQYMKFVREYYGDKIKSFVLQLFIEGTIVSSEYWCDGTKFIGPPNQTVEVKKFMNDDLGPSTGCSGNLVWLVDESCEIIQQGIALVEEAVVKEGYVGPLDLNAIFNEQGVYGLEWTPRFGLDALPTFMQLFRSDIGKFISDLVNGTCKRVPVNDYFAGGIRVSIPPYPLEPDKATEVQKVCPNLGLPIRGIEESDLKHFYFYEVMKKEDELFHSEGTGVIAVVSDYDDHPAGTLNLPMKIIEELKIPDKQYRTDLQEVLPKMYDEIKEREQCLV